MSSVPCFNGGPGNCPAKTRAAIDSAHDRSPSFNGGPGNCPAKPRCLDHSTGSAGRALQWRAGQLPGQTRRRCSRGVGAVGLDASMEGRAIARPNTLPARTGHQRRQRSLQWRAGQLPGQTSSHVWIICRAGLVQASMEGRAIARPNPPARPPDAAGLALQWRAGQLPGQTSTTVDSRQAASMEGRAIAGQTPTSSPSLSSVTTLQWRAGQLPGQTSTSRLQPRSVIASFNGGPGNCPAKRRRIALTRSSFNGGPGARPNSTPLTPPAPRSGFNGGPGNCPAKQDSRSDPPHRNRLQWRAGLPGDALS